MFAGQPRLGEGPLTFSVTYLTPDESVCREARIGDRQTRHWACPPPPPPERNSAGKVIRFSVLFLIYLDGRLMVASNIHCFFRVKLTFFYGN